MKGLGVMLHELGGGTKNSASKYYGRKIKGASFGNDQMSLTFDDGVTIHITDDRQSCCEHRYMVCDDDVKSLIGQKLKGIVIKSTEDKESEYGNSHEICFLEIQGNKSSISFATHNEHNGYYGGFGLNILEHT
jgi:hypothetical protein